MGQSTRVASSRPLTVQLRRKVEEEKVNGETRILRQFKLLTEKAEGKGGSQVRKPVQLQQISEPGLQYDQPAQIVSEKPTASGNVFTCVSEGEEDTDEAEYVWVNGRLEKKVKKGKEKQGKEKALKCKLVPGGVRKVKAMEKKLKAISKDLKRFSRILGQFSSPGGER